jgi:hypothetical protein
MAERDRLESGELVAAARTAEADRHLVADKSATTVDEDGRPAREARPVLLAAAGGRAHLTRRLFGAIVQRFDGAVGASGVTMPFTVTTVRSMPEAGVVSEKSPASVAIRSIEGPNRAQTGVRGTPRRTPHGRRWAGLDEG